jgi:hypothetical protein
VEKRRDREALEDFYYSAIYDALQDETNNSEKAITLKLIQASIVGLSGTYYRSMWVDCAEQDRHEREEPSLYHIIKERGRKIQRTAHMIHDKTGTPQKASRDILRVFADHFKSKYDTIEVDGGSLERIMECNMLMIPDAANLALEEPITLGELHHVIKTGKPHKSPGYDGISLEFFKKFFKEPTSELPTLWSYVYLHF